MTPKSPTETKYFYQDLDANGGRLNGAHRYAVAFAKGRVVDTTSCANHTAQTALRRNAPGLRRTIPRSRLQAARSGTGLRIARHQTRPA
jgi:hypothetical protein